MPVETDLMAPQVIRLSKGNIQHIKPFARIENECSNNTWDMIPYGLPSMVMDYLPWLSKNISNTIAARSCCFLVLDAIEMLISIIVNALVQHGDS
mmetsp:Transcript_13917/g.21219  ORF Transcript_13917/g.21219 Transcript_13917/m.21219 type:complete len:95 (+) Transcript_13917:140-424(+)